jgi:hypothetical protein
MKRKRDDDQEKITDLSLQFNTLQTAYTNEMHALKEELEKEKKASRENKAALDQFTKDFAEFKTACENKFSLSNTEFDQKVSTIKSALNQLLEKKLTSIEATLSNVVTTNGTYNIKVGGGMDNSRLLSANPDHNVDLYNKDDNSGRQKWIFIPVK